MNDLEESSGYKGPPVMSVREVAALMRVGRSLIYEMVRAGILANIKVGRRRILIPRSAVVALIESGGDSTKRRFGEVKSL